MASFDAFFCCQIRLFSTNQLTQSVVMSSSPFSKENVKKTLENAKSNPSKENFIALQKTVLQYIDAQLKDADTTVNQKVESLMKELQALKSDKAAANTALAQTQKELQTTKSAKEAADASLAKMQDELKTIQQALAACKSTEGALSQRANMINESMNVVKTVIGRSNTKV
jgi:chromosome segregation ATPase